MAVSNGQNATKFRFKIIEMHDLGFKNCEIMRALELSVGKVAGVIWRYNNPGMWKKGVGYRKKDKYK